MVRTRVSSRLVAAALFAGLLAAGCSDADGEPAPTAEPSVTDVPSEAPSSPEPTSPDPGPTPWPEPTRPAAMERDDIEGAKAAAEYFLALYPYAYVAGDLNAWQQMIHPECNFCASVISNVEDLHSDGGFADGPSVELLTIDGMPPNESYEYFAVWVEVREGAHAYYDESGSATKRFDSSTLEIDLALTRSDDGWLIRGVTVAQAVGADHDA